MQDKIAAYRKELNQCFDGLDSKKLERIVMELLKRGRTIYIIGNGGSASTASHMAVDFSKGTHVPNAHKLRIVSLTDNVAMITALSNDLSYDFVFQKQLEPMLTHRDALIAISASGDSKNILRAVDYANDVGALTIGLTGFGGGTLKNLVDIGITVSSHNYGVVEDFHLSLGHILSQFIKKHLEGGEHWKQASL
jgi:D-sedoheptulose 7-phosphate isomerase